MTKFVDNAARRVKVGLDHSQARLVGEVLRAILKQRRLTQKAVADFVGVTEAAISRWCASRDTPSEENLSRLADAVGVRRETLLLVNGHHGLKLTRAIRPGEFEAGDVMQPDAQTSPANAAVSAVKARANKAAHERVLNARLEIEARRDIRRRLDRLPKGDWRGRMEIAGDRCMLCAAPMPHTGICESCGETDR